MAASFEKSLAAGMDGPVDLQVEYLALADGAREPYASQLADFLRRKYQGHLIRIVAPVDPPAIEFYVRNRSALFPGIPIVTSMIVPTSAETRPVPENSTGVSLVLDRQRTVEIALDLHPRTREVVLVAGAAPRDLMLTSFARTLVEASKPGLPTRSLAGRPLEEQLEALEQLPDDRVVIFVDYTQDSAGRPTVARQILRRVASRSRAPVYGAAETYLGFGIAGGDIIRFGPIGEKAGALAARILRGEPASSIKPVRTASSQLVFDVRELRRWKIDEDRLPAGSLVLYREPSLWRDYRGGVLLAVAFLLAQTALLGALLVERRKRRGAEVTVRAAELRYRTVAEYTYDWEYWRRPDGSFVYVSPSCARTTGHDAAAFHARPQLMEELIVEEDRSLWLGHAEGARAGEDFLHLELRIRTANGQVRWIDHVCAPVTGEDGSFLGVRGSNRDITERKRAEEDLRNALAEIERLRDRLEADNSYLREQVEPAEGFEGIVGRSDVLRYVLSRVQQVAPTASAVLLQGETGVGKELVAHAVHNLSPRRARPLVKLNCAALPASLVESELFGHEKGAFTGAIALRKGRFEIADGSTLFLDEIGELPLELQAKLLRVIQEGEFERVGGSRTLKTDARLVAATNRRLDEEVKAGRFREDLWYRLNVFPITMPPLRQRPEDVPLLVGFFVEKHCRKLGRKPLDVSQGTLRDLQAHDWPGNVRELESFIERAVITSPGPTLRVVDKLAPPTGPIASPTAAAGPARTLEEVERMHIQATVERLEWRVEGPGAAAEILGINPSTLRSRMRKLGIRRPGRVGGVPAG
jgi:PAS domain S-box-containing protein